MVESCNVFYHLNEMINVNPYPIFGHIQTLVSPGSCIIIFCFSPDQNLPVVMGLSVIVSRSNITVGSNTTGSAMFVKENTKSFSSLIFNFYTLKKWMLLMSMK